MLLTSGICEGMFCLKSLIYGVYRDTAAFTSAQLSQFSMRHDAAKEKSALFSWAKALSFCFSSIFPWLRVVEDETWVEWFLLVQWNNIPPTQRSHRLYLLKRERIFSNHITNDCILVWNIKLFINVKPAFFYTKPFVYKSVAICLIMIKLLHHPV